MPAVPAFSNDSSASGVETSACIQLTTSLRNRKNRENGDLCCIPAGLARAAHQYGAHASHYKVVRTHLQRTPLFRHFQESPLRISGTEELPTFDVPDAWRRIYLSLTSRTLWTRSVVHRGCLICQPVQAGSPRPLLGNARPKRPDASTHIRPEPQAALQPLPSPAKLKPAQPSPLDTALSLDGLDFVELLGFDRH